MLAFDELPINEVVGLRQAWGVFGPEDSLGTANFLSPERVVSAAHLVQNGTVVNLCIPLTALDPPLFDREPVRHTIFSENRNSLDDRLDCLYLQSSSHWDGLRHVQARQAGSWGGRLQEEIKRPGSGPLGIEHWAKHGLVGRGVLLDIARVLAREDTTYDPFRERSITVEDLENIASRQGVKVKPGDILCIRTGWTEKYLSSRGASESGRSSTREFAGLAAGEAMARWLWDNNIAALACDNPAVEVAPGDPEVGSLHRRLIPLLGMVLGELFDLQGLSVACATENRWEFLFVSVPLNLPGGVGSPANAVAIL